MLAVDRRQDRGVLHGQHIGSRDHETADRRERLGVPEHQLAPARLGEELGEPGDGGDELDADADE
jgi:hypothetical protein